MKKLIAGILLSIGLVIPLSSFAQINSKLNQQDNHRPQMIQGTVVSTDPAAGTITVNDQASGAERTFTVTTKAELYDLQGGDKVNITLQNNSATAANVQKSS
jgi:Cu/Ag efflux protein CusF